MMNTIRRCAPCLFFYNIFRFYVKVGKKYYAQTFLQLCKNAVKNIINK